MACDTDGIIQWTTITVPSLATPLSHVFFTRLASKGTKDRHNSFMCGELITSACMLQISLIDNGMRT